MMARNCGGLRRVTVVGAGITGLTAAHELIERGFDVQVVESARAANAKGERGMAVGGLARSQYSRIPRGAPPAKLRDALHDRAPMQQVDPTTEPSVTTIRFVPGSTELDSSGRGALEQLAVRLRGSLSNYGIELVGRADASGEADPVRPEARRALAAARAQQVLQALRAAGIAEERFGRVTTSACYAPNGTEIDATLDCRVDVQLQDFITPGEHGFRFVPGCYRHLRDTLKRIPLYGDRGATAETVANRLVGVTTQLLTRAGKPAVELQRSAMGRLAIVQASVTQLDYPARDAALLMLRLLRFATSCAARRRHYEALSWWDFCTRQDLQPGPSDSDQLARLPYSPGFLEYLWHAPRALVAMDARYADARTQGLMYLQLVGDQLAASGKPVDQVFDAPTSEAWLEPWRHHLEIMGVRFFAGRLANLEPRLEGDRRELQPTFEATEPGGLDGLIGDVDYVVIATDLLAAQRIAEPVRAWGQQMSVDVGIFAQLDAFALEEPEGPAGEIGHRRDPERELGLRAWDRLQTMSGVQFFCGHKTELAHGFVYALDSSWALTSITHTSHWRGRYSLAQNGCLSVISVDIGDFRVASLATGRTAAECSQQELADEVWRQLRGSVAGLEDDARWPTPLYYHVDEGLELQAGGLRNRTPYLINVAGDWPRRPGMEPFDPRFRRDATSTLPSGACWQAAHGGYQVHFERFVFAGTYLRTFTRLTTMESANESARHAVNAILDHVASRSGQLREAHERANDPVLRSTVATPASSALTSGAGDYCSIWQPELHEFPELDFLKELDAELLERQLPHLADILELDLLPQDMSDTDDEPLLAVLRKMSDRLQAQIDSKQTGNEDSLGRLLKLITQVFEGP